MAKEEIIKNEFSYEAAVKFAANYVDKQFRVFISDQMVEAWNQKNEPPTDARIWGGIITILKSEGKIKSFGARMYKPHNGGKMRYATEWISKVYSERQSENSKSMPGQIKIEYTDGK